MQRRWLLLASEVTKLQPNTLFRAAHEDEEYLEYVADAWRGNRPHEDGESAEMWVHRMSNARKLWKPGEIIHKTRGGNVIVLPLPATLDAAWAREERNAVREAKRLIRDAAQRVREQNLDGAAAIVEFERIIAAMRANNPALMRVAGGAGAGAWTFTNTSRTNMLSGNQAIGTDTFKMALFLSTSDIGATENAYSGVTDEVAAANGYSTGGTSVTLGLSGTTTVTVSITDASWTASGGTIVFRFMVVYEVSANVTTYALGDSAPADVTTQNGNTLTVSGANNLFTLA